MFDDETKRRERAYRLWEEEGRPEGRHEDHWTRAGEGGELSQQESEDVTEVNQEADRAFDAGKGSDRSPTEIRPPSTISPD